MEQSLQMEPVIRPLCTVTVIDGKTVISAEIHYQTFIGLDSHHAGHLDDGVLLHELDR